MLASLFVLLVATPEVLVPIDELFEAIVSLAAVRSEFVLAKPDVLVFIELVFAWTEDLFPAISVVRIEILDVLDCMEALLLSISVLLLAIPDVLVAIDELLDEMEEVFDTIVDLADSRSEFVDAKSEAVVEIEDVLLAIEDD